MEDLIKGMIVQSATTRVSPWPRAIAGSEENFAQMMNQEAQRLGMKTSNFRNSTGLPDAQHYTTARDLSCSPQRSSATSPPSTASTTR